LLGGYIVAEPTLIGSKAYCFDDWDVLAGEAPQLAPAPSWLLDRLVKANPAAVATTLHITTVEPHVIEELRSALQVIDADDRDTWIAMGRALRELGVPGYELWIEYSQRSPKFDAREAVKTWYSLSGSRFGYAKVLVAAGVPAIDLEACWAAQERRKAAGKSAQEAIARARVGAVHDDRRPRRFGFVSAADMELKPVDWLVRGYLERDSLSVVFGEPKKGKSFVAIDIACSVASGSDWHGQCVKQGAVFYIAGEGHNGLSRRFHAWRKLRGINPPRHMLHVSTCAAQLTSAASAAEVSAAVRALADAADCEPALIIVDTLARNFGPADENSTQDMGAFVANLDAELRLPWGAAVLVVHHSGKDAAKGARGSSALFGAVDAQYEVTRDESGIVRLTAHVMKDADIPAPLAFKLCSVKLPLIDEDGQQVFGATLEPAAYVEPAHKGKEGRGKNQTAALQALAELEREHRQTLSDGGYDPDEALVKESTWIDRLEELGMPRQRRSEVVNSLIERERVRRTVGGYVELA
jgi:hypothetical protein